MPRSNNEFDRVDPSLFRAFMAAAETKNFTQAAKVAAMTQSGISQQIAKLENQLGVQLFARSNKSVLLTEAGRHLTRFVETYLDSTAVLQDLLRKETAELAGSVYYGMPESCLISPHLSMLLQKRQKHPKIELHIELITNERVLAGILSGRLDFGFITQNLDVTGLTMTPYCEEEFVLLSAAGVDAAKIGLDFLTESTWVVYPGLETYLIDWFGHYFPKATVPHVDSLPYAGKIDSIHGALKLIAGGVGISVVPRHCAEHLLETKEFQILRPETKKTPVKSMIYIAHLSSRLLTKRTKQVMDWFFAMHPEVKRP